MKRDLRIKSEDFPKLYRLTVLALTNPQQKTLEPDEKEYAKKLQ